MPLRWFSPPSVRAAEKYQSSELINGVLIPSSIPSTFDDLTLPGKFSEQSACPVPADFEVGLYRLDQFGVFHGRTIETGFEAFTTLGFRHHLAFGGHAYDLGQVIETMGEGEILERFS